ncbi:MAG: PEP-CTERM sorting domain-containing protein [Dehalococcoidia bacterium]|nr:PEP-CTERM sorting domain-containing protein [Dehalococcoidia bacterium]
MLSILPRLPWLAAVLLTAPLLPAAVPASVDAQEAEETRYTFSFENDAEGWVGDFADLPVDAPQDLYELDGGHRPLPEGLDGSGIYVQGHNRSDDLFMFLKRQVGGLRPDTEYAVSISVDLATSIPPGLVGIGGSPGESVYVKAGASPVEPVTSEDDIGHLRLNIDKGNQARGGEAMVVLGDIAHPDAARDAYAIKTLTNADQPLTVRTDGEGRLWLIVGTDSGFEGFTTLYYARIAYTLTEVADPGPGATGSGLARTSSGGWPLEGLVLGAVAVALAGLGLRARSRRGGQWGGW